MGLNFDDVFATVTLPGVGDALESWRWLAPIEHTPFLVTALGDCFTEGPGGQVGFLDTYEGRFEHVAANRAGWKALLQDMILQSQWFTPGLVVALRSRSMAPGPEESYSPIRPLILGGTMEPENFEVTQWRVHVSIMGQIYEQTRHLPEGTPITGFVSKP